MSDDMAQQLIDAVYYLASRIYILGVGLSLVIFGSALIIANTKGSR